MSPEPISYYTSLERLEDLSGSDIGGLVPVFDWDEETCQFAILDCFEQQLRQSRRLLMAIDGKLELLTATSGTLNQLAKRDARFVAQFHDGPVKEALSDLSPLRAFLDVASGLLRNGTLTLLDDEGKTQARARLRQLTPEDGNAVVLISPARLRGYDDALDALTARIRACGGTPLNGGNFYRMINHASVGYVAKPTIAIDRRDTAFDTATSLIGSYLPVARANEYGIVCDLDTEFLHDYRIALRKVRSVLSLLKGVYATDQTDELKARFSALMASTNSLRDLDVYLLDQDAFRALVPESMHEGLDAMFGLIRARRKKEQAQLAQYLESGRYNTEMKALAKLFAKKRKLIPGPNASRASYDLACELIWKRYRKIRRAAASIVAETPDEEIHSLRIECKKLRYLMELFASMFPPEQFSRLLKSLKRLQDSLGLFNDCSVQQASLQSFVESLGNEQQQLGIAQSVGALITVLHQRQIAEREKITGAFARFSDDNTKRSFSVLFRNGKEI